MTAQKYAILSTSESSFLNDLGHGYVREFIKNGAMLIDYEEAYLKLGNRNVQDFILNAISENNIEVLIYQSNPADFHFNMEFFRLLQEKVYTVMMLGDTDHYFDVRDIYYAQCMDLVLVYDCMSRYRYQRYGINAISFYSSFDKDRYFIMDGIEKSIDVSFVGDIAYKKDRKAYIDYISENGISVEVFGTGSKNGQVSLEEMVEIFNKTKVNLGFTKLSLINPLKKELNISSRVKQMKGRMTEAALCGGFVLNEYVPGIEEVFEVGSEIEVFHTKEEMIEKIKYYLENEEERESMAKRGYARALKDYEISTAIPKLINKIDEFRKAKTRRLSKIYVDNHFMKNYTTFRAEMIVKFIKLKKWGLLCEEFSLILKNKKLNLVRASGVFLFGIFPFLRKIYLIRKNNKHA